MPGLDQYFSDVSETCDHPLARYLAELRNRPGFGEAKVEILRPKGPFVSEPAKLYLHCYDSDGREMDRPYPEDWDDELNSALVRMGIRAVDPDNEKTRFGLALRAALQGAESRFGDGYFNGVLVHHVENGPFKNRPEVADVLRHVYRGGIDPSRQSYTDCRAMIDGAIRGRANELVKDLHYEIAEAEEILAAAVARVLDERFTVSSRRALGML